MDFIRYYNRDCGYLGNRSDKDNSGNCDSIFPRVSGKGEAERRERKGKRKKRKKKKNRSVRLYKYALLRTIAESLANF